MSNLSVLIVLEEALSNLDADFALKNAFIESFTIHARVLAVFLYDKPQRDDDVTAED